MIYANQPQIEKIGIKGSISTSVILNKEKFINLLNELLKKNDIRYLKEYISKIIHIINHPGSDSEGIINNEKNDGTISIRNDILLNDLRQIIEAHTLERANYYIKRLKNGLIEYKTNRINDINLNRWKEYSDIITDSLWILDKRDKSGAHNAAYWGNFIPQIPNQLLRRYTKKGEWVLDTFLGSGTTLIECNRLGRNGVGIELNPAVIEIAKKNISEEKNIYNVITNIINADSTEFSFEDELEKTGIKNFHFIIMHPPYWDIIKFSDDSRDLSNSHNLREFQEKLRLIIEKTYKILDKNRYCTLVIGDKYYKGEWIPLGFYTMQLFLEAGYKLKSIIVKNFEETKGKMNQEELWRYRALVGGFYIFKHEYVFIFKK